MCLALLVEIRLDVEQNHAISLVKACAQLIVKPYFSVAILARDRQLFKWVN